MQLIGYVLVAVGVLAFIAYMAGSPFNNPRYRAPAAGAGCALLPAVIGALVLWMTAG